MNNDSQTHDSTPQMPSSEDLEVNSLEQEQQDDLESPLLTLVDKLVDEMTDEELDAHISHLRQVTESAQTLRASITRNKGASTRTPKTIDKALADELLDL